MSIHPKSKMILEAVLELADVALDFVEQELGANNFKDNWKRLKAQGTEIETISAWLTDTAIMADPQAIADVVDSYAAKGASWLTPYTSPIPPEDWRVSKVS